MKKHFGFGKKGALEVCWFYFILIYKCNYLYSGIDIYINVLSTQKKIKTYIQHFDDLHDIMSLQKKNEFEKNLTTHKRQFITFRLKKSINKNLRSYFRPCKTLN